jgi:hypothetical protein
MQRVYIAGDLAMAQLVVDRLAQHGIAARALNTHASTLAGELPALLTCPEIWVDDPGDAVAARQVIETMELTVSSDALKACTFCGEQSPIEFEICWHCEAELP